MKFLLSFAAVIAVAVAVPTQRGLVIPEGAGPAPAPIMPEGAGPVPAPMPEPIAVGPAVIQPEPIAIGPAIVDNFEPIAIGPAIIDFPVPSPAEDSVESTPLFPATPVVQIILNINTENAASPEPVITPSPAIVDPVSPVQVVETAPIPAEPVVIGTPILPAPAVTLPEELN